MYTLEELLLALLLQLVGDVIFLISQLLTVSVSVRVVLSDVVGNGKEVHRVIDEFLIGPSSFMQEMPARAVEYTGYSSMINTLCTAFSVPSRAIHMIRCYPHSESFVVWLSTC